MIKKRCYLFPMEIKNQGPYDGIDDLIQMSYDRSSTPFFHDFLRKGSSCEFGFRYYDKFGRNF